MSEQGQSPAFQMPDVNQFKADYERAQQLAAQRANNGGNSDSNPIYFYEWKDGDNTFLVLPSGGENPNKWIHKVYTMKNLKPTGTAKYQCIEMTYPELGIQCPLLAEIKLAKSKGQDVSSQEPVFRGFMTILDYNGQVETWEENGKMVTADCKYLPQIVNLPPSMYDAIVALMFDPSTAGFMDPNGAIPITINRTQKNIMTYTLSVVKVPDAKNPRNLVPLRIPVADTAEQMTEVLQKNYDLTKIFRAPVEEVKSPNGSIFKAAMEFRQYYDMLSGSTTMAPPTATPAPTLGNTSYNPAPTAKPEPSKPTSGIPGAPSCMGNLNTPAQGHNCDVCMYKVVCQAQSSK